MKRTLLAARLAIALCLPAISQAAAVHSHYTLVAGSTWTADFTITNDGNPAQITGFTIYLPETAFSNVSLLAAPGTWDTLLIAPDLGLPAAGFLDSFALNVADAIDLGEQLGGFRIQFDSVSGRVPSALAFDITDPNFTVLYSGITSVSVIPEPSPLLLLALAPMLAIGAQRRVGASRRDGQAAA